MEFRSVPDDLVLNKKDVPEQEDNQIAAFGTSSFYVTGRRSRSGCSVGCWMFRLDVHTRIYRK